MQTHVHAFSDEMTIVQAIYRMMLDWKVSYWSLKWFLRTFTDKKVPKKKNDNLQFKILLENNKFYNIFAQIIQEHNWYTALLTICLQDALKSFDFLPEDHQSNVIDLDNMEPPLVDQRPVSHKEYRAPSPPQTVQSRVPPHSAAETPKSSRQQSYAMETE
jgi:hypothetical protein